MDRKTRRAFRNPRGRGHVMSVRYWPKYR
ncbi:hypothetical protein EXU85_30565 [Spirosoma sp. KCTC 42546]|nr:hypothetical protein EXU85_30565 [Spirosoma sp. KCTC 42546]